MAHNSKEVLNNIIVGVAKSIIEIRAKEYTDYNHGRLQAYCHVLSLSGCSHKRIKDITGIELIDK
jgi:hypothetical protein